MAGHLEHYPFSRRAIEFTGQKNLFSSAELNSLTAPVRKLFLTSPIINFFRRNSDCSRLRCLLLVQLGDLNRWGEISANNGLSDLITKGKLKDKLTLTLQMNGWLLCVGLVLMSLYNPSMHKRIIKSRVMINLNFSLFIF